MKKLKPFVKLPNSWIEAGGLRQFTWRDGTGPANLAALIVLSVIAHHSDTENGAAEVTYDEIHACASLSRALISAGLAVLVERGILKRGPGRSALQLADFDPNARWAKLPAKGLYANGVILGFTDFQKRKPVELDAMKLYFLIASRRSRQLNLALLTFDAIEKLSGIKRYNIKRALSFLCAAQLILIEHLPRRYGEQGTVSAYRLTHLDSYNHMGTTGRGLDAIDLEDAFSHALPSVSV